MCMAHSSRRRLQAVAIRPSEVAASGKVRTLGGETGSHWLRSDESHRVPPVNESSDETCCSYSATNRTHIERSPVGGSRAETTATSAERLNCASRSVQVTPSAEVTSLSCDAGEPNAVVMWPVTDSTRFPLASAAPSTEPKP